VNCLSIDTIYGARRDSGTSAEVTHRTDNLRQDPYERFIGESQMYLRWMADKMWTMVPAQTVVREHLESLMEFPPTKGPSLSVNKVLEQMQTQKARQ